VTRGVADWPTRPGAGAGPSLRILHIIDGLGLGGAEVQLLRLLRYLPAGRFAHVVCHIGPPADLAEQIRAMDIPVHDLSKAGRRSMLAATVSLVGHIRRYRPGLIHTDGLYSSPCGRLAGLMTHLPVLTTIGNTLGNPFRRPVALRRRALVRRVIWQANRITAHLTRCHFMAVTGAVRDSVVRVFGVDPDRVAVIYRGIDLAQMGQQAPATISALRSEVAPPDAWPLLINVGRLARQKGQEELIRAVAIVRRRYPKVYLLLVGDGPLAANYRAVASECSVGDAVRFLGRRSDVPALLQASDLFVFPSLYEGAAGAMLEAMAMHRPIVASEIPTLVEAAGDAAVWAPSRNAPALAEAIMHLAARPEVWRSMGARGRRIVEQRFDIKPNASEFGRLCERLAARRGTAAMRSDARSTIPASRTSP